MEHLSGYTELFDQKGGSLELVGLEAFAPTSSHPLGVQSRANRSKFRMQGSAGSAQGPRLSAKQEKLSAFAVLNELKFTAWPQSKWDELVEQFKYFNHRRIDYTTNLLKDVDQNFYALEVSSHSGEFIMKDSQHLACVVMEPQVSNLPEFVLDRERIFSRLAQYTGVKDVEIGNPIFDAKFKLKGPDPKAIRAFFTDKCVDFLLEHPDFHMESNGKSILIFHKERVASVAEFKLMVSFARDWAKQI